MNAVEEAQISCGEDRDENVLIKEMALVAKYIPHRPYLNTNDPHFLQLSFARAFVRDGERYLGM